MVDNGPIAELTVGDDPLPIPPAISVAIAGFVEIAEVFVLFDDVTELVELLPVRVDPPVPVGNAKTNTVPSMVVEIPVLANQRRLVPHGPSQDGPSITHLMKSHCF